MINKCIDPFLNKQPKIEFAEELKTPLHTASPFHSKMKKLWKNGLYVNALKLAYNFPDDEKLLETAYNDFNRFLSSANITLGNNGIVFRTLKEERFSAEEFELLVSSDSIILKSFDTEGIRRGLVFIEDEMIRSGAAFLKFGKTRKKPFIKKRISRCYFTPPSHSSGEKLESELADDTDYYPENYLNRLAHDGTNGLWIGVNFRDLLKSNIIPEYGVDSQKRLSKLNRITEKCRRYGIGVYALVIEPASGYNNPAFENHRELHGGKSSWGDFHLFCPSKPQFELYIKEAFDNLFRAVPHLAGIIDITCGEALSSCASSTELTCPECVKKFKTLGRAFAAVESIIANALKEAAPHAEFISWSYAQRAWTNEDVIESCQHRDKAVIHMQNFEDVGYPVQLNKQRFATDYWLSYVGPGELMKTSLAVNSSRNVRTYAKIQVCSSHELSSVPYVPVPGILYDKFKYMREHEVAGVVECWYFGNYPCLMSKAAGELSFDDFPCSKKYFLRNLAKLYYNGDDISNVVAAWETFEKSYKNFPINVAFEWFGPMQDAVAAPLHLLPADLPMPGTWLISDPVGGDRTGEYLLNGHTSDEAEILIGKMNNLWHKGIEILDSVNISREEQAEKDSVYNAIAVLFDSGYNFIKFYSLRRMLGIGASDPSFILSQMKDIIEKEKLNSLKMIKLCKKDKRLGYHSEAFGFKFFPAKLQWRIKQLRKLLNTEFPLVEQRIRENKVPLSFYYGEHKSARKLVLAANTAQAKLLSFYNENLKKSSFTSFSATERNGQITLRFILKDNENDTLIIKPEFHMFHPTAPIVLNNELAPMQEEPKFSLVKQTLEKYSDSFVKTVEKDGHTTIFTLSFSRKAFEMTDDEPFRLAVERLGRHNESLCRPKRFYTRLILGTFSPESYCFILKNVRR